MKNTVKVLIAIGVMVFVYMLIFDNGTSSQSVSNAPPTPEAAYTAENCVHDLAIRYADAVKRDMDNKVPLSDTKLANQLREYEREKGECYERY